MEKRKLIKLLKPYWNEFILIQNIYFDKLKILEKTMNKELKKYKIPELQFFHVEGEVVGIGAENWKDRKHFPLINDTDLWENE